MKTKFFAVLFVLFAAQFVAAQDKTNANARTSRALAKQQDFKTYHGAYSTTGSEDIIVIVDAGDRLLCKIPGKPSIPLESTGTHLFKSEKEGITIIFNPEKKQFIMTEKGVARTYTKT